MERWPIENHDVNVTWSPSRNKPPYFLQERHNEYHVIIQLRNCVAQHKQKVYMFECLELDEVASAIEYHAPRLAGWVTSGRQWKSNKVLYRGLVEKRKIPHLGQ